MLEKVYSKIDFYMIHDELIYFSVSSIPAQPNDFVIESFWMSERIKIDGHSLCLQTNLS